MLKDLRFALRQLLKQWGFTAIAVLTLALAIGATTAVISLVNALLVRPLPYREPQQLVLLLQHFKSQNLERIPVSPAEFVDYETRAHSFEKLGAFSYASFNLAGEDKPERISGATITAGVLPLLGVSPIKGRFFEPEECTLGRRRCRDHQRASVGAPVQQRPADRRHEASPQRQNLHRCRSDAGEFRFSSSAFQPWQRCPIWRAR